MSLPVVTALCGTRPAYAQAPPGPPADGSVDADKAAVSPPRLVHAFEADYPAEALAARVEGTVVLRLTIDKGGGVVGVDVVEPAGHGFDEAAAAAVRGFRFEPARRAGAPVNARILYRYVFQLPPPAAPTPPAVVAATLTGRVVDARSSAPVAGADVTLLRDGREIARATTDTNGRFALRDLTEGPARVTAQRAGAVASADVEIAASRATDVALTLAAPAAQAPSASPIQVSVRGQQSETKRLRESAEAVTVIDTHRARQQTRDLGEALASVEGVAFRRSGGLGSFSRLSLNGLYDEQIRLFLNEVPLDVVGYPFGIANVPVSLIERVEIYRGVLPARLGADALGGAINLVTDQRYETRAFVSYQRGSFGTHRLSALGRYRHEPTGLFVGATGWLDVSRNDYTIDVEVADKSGRKRPVQVRRFHDAYGARGGSVEVGVVDKPWAKRLVVQLFGSTFDKEIQHNLFMTQPFGEATYGESSLGVIGRYEQPLSSDFALSLIASVSRRTIDFVDKGEWSYDWYGNRVKRLSKAGEILYEPHDLTIDQDNVFGRAQVEWRFLPEHLVRLASTGRRFNRTGEERAGLGEDQVDTLAAPRTLFTLTSGIEYELNAFDRRAAAERAQPFDPARDDRLQNVLFVKHYFARASAESVRLENTGLRSVDYARHLFGVGDGLRLRITDWLTGKASYELAARLPSVDELYGTGTIIGANPDLEPESSRNGNLGLRAELPGTVIGGVVAEANGFLRDASQQIVLQASGTGATFSQYKNLVDARVYGVEGSFAWTSPGRWVALGGNATWQDARNTSSSGEFKNFADDRIPNRPWLFANWSGRLQWRGVMTREDELSPFYEGRFVHEFFRTWESIGDKRFKALIPTQVSHSIGLTYTSDGPLRTSTTFQIENLTDATIYDFFGVQRPGRSVAVKVTGEI